MLSRPRISLKYCNFALKPHIRTLATESNLTGPEWEADRKVLYDECKQILTEFKNNGQAAFKRSLITLPRTKSRACGLTVRPKCRVNRGKMGHGMRTVRGEVGQCPFKKIRWLFNKSDSL